MNPTRFPIPLRRSWALPLLWLAATSAWAQNPSLWFDADHRPNSQSRQALELLSNASADGLRPQDYRVDVLRKWFGPASDAPASQEIEAKADAALTSAVVLYLEDLHQGRVRPKEVQANYDPSRDASTFDARSVLERALAEQRLDAAARTAAPTLPMYAELREELRRYRDLATQPLWKQPLPPLPGAGRKSVGKLTPGQAYTGVAPLAQRLRILGDLSESTAAPTANGGRYEGALVEAVKAFQTRHGLTADGVIGGTTWAQLNVTPADRARQIEITMERLRWTPLTQGPRQITVNIPEFTLRAYEVDNGQISVQREMRVIVGKALDTRTPVFDENMRFVEFSPYWNVPPSIAKEELIPRLRRDPGYFQRMDFEFVGAGGGDRVLTGGKLDAVLAGQMRIRQRPGDKNALGDIKFVFPNRDNIYLHHTPSVGLFARDRRDFSHGCIRVEKPVELATFVFKNMPGWDESKIRQAMEKGTSMTVKLTEPIPVLIAYGTTVVKNGRIHFYDDIYGLDRQLEAALQKHGKERDAGL